MADLGVISSLGLDEVEDAVLGGEPLMPGDSRLTILLGVRLARCLLGVAWRLSGIGLVGRGILLMGTPSTGLTGVCILGMGTLVLLGVVMPPPSEATGLGLRTVSNPGL